MNILRKIMLTVVIGFGFVPLSFADLTINLVAVNGSDEVKEIDVKSYLPKELEPPDILDTGALTVQYDVDKGSYFVTGKTTFQPKESKTFKIKVADVWKIRPDEIDILRKQVEENLRLLKGKPKFEVGQEAQEFLLSRLESIYLQEQTYSEDIERRIEQYRANIDELNYVRKKIYAFDYLAVEAEPEALVPSKTVKFILEVKNPSEFNEKEVNQKHYLPKEIKPANVVDSKGFDVRYDEKKALFYLTKKETFKPSEVKKYEIIIHDVWTHPQGKLDALAARGLTALNEVRDSMYTASGDFLYQDVLRKLEQIKESQEKDLPIKDHIGLFRVNGQRFTDAEELVDRMEHLMAIVRAKRLEELEKGKVKNVLQRLKALKGLAQLSEAIFKKGITLTTVWRIIFATLGFVAFFTTLNFVIWVRRSANMGEEGTKGPIKEVPKPGAAAATAEPEEEKGKAKPNPKPAKA
jgi:hypothetical protein